MQMTTATTGSKRRTKKEMERNLMALLLDNDPIARKQALLNVTETLHVDDLVPFADHPFKLYDGERLDDMVRSIRERGVITPVIVRPQPDGDEGMYEILSGHNRVNAAKIAGLTEVPCIIKEGLTDDEAKLIVTETNLMQRSFSELSHSERAIALKHHMDAIRAQGKQTGLIGEIEKFSTPDEIMQTEEPGLIVPKSETRDKAAEKYGLDARSVSRYIRLTHLTEELLRRVDNDEIGLYPAVSLSYLSLDEQIAVNKVLEDTSCKVDMKKAEALREHSKNKKLIDENVVPILSGELDKRTNAKSPPPALKIKYKVYSKFFSADTNQKEMEAVVEQALTEYFANHKKQEGEGSI